MSHLTPRRSKFNGSVDLVAWFHKFLAQLLCVLYAVFSLFLLSFDDLNLWAAANKKINTEPQIMLNTGFQRYYINTYVYLYVYYMYIFYIYLHMYILYTHHISTNGIPSTQRHKFRLWNQPSSLHHLRTGYTRMNKTSKNWGYASTSLSYSATL